MPRAAPFPVRRLARLPALSAALTLITACGGSGAPAATGSAAPSATPAHSVTATRPVSQTTARPPAIVAVTARGALVLLSPATGTPVRTLVRTGVVGEEISVSADGRLIYFTGGTAAWTTCTRWRPAAGSRC